MIVMGLLRVGSLIRHIPNLVIVGFMNGISLLIWWDQCKKLFGLAGQAILSGPLVLNVIMIPATLIIIVVLSVLHAVL